MTLLSKEPSAISILATIEQENLSRRSSTRFKLRLAAVGSIASAQQETVRIHNVSQTGLLIETSSPLPVGGRLEVEMPLVGGVSAEIIWTSGALYGCRFKEQMSQAAVSAALLQAEPETAENIGPTETMRCSAVGLMEGFSEEETEQSQYRDALFPYENQETDKSEAADGRPSLQRRVQFILAASLSLWALILFVVL